MTIKQQGGIFGRNPTFNDVDVEGTLNVDGSAVASTGSANEFTQEQEIKVTDATAYDASAADAQVTVGPSLFLNNPANSNATVGGQVVFGLRSATNYARIGATGGTARSIFVGIGTSEVARFTSNGLTFNGDTVAANALDDYEEGTWTPTLNAYGGTPTVSGYYVKIGQMVYVECSIELDGTSDASNYIIDGLPFSMLSPQLGGGAVNTNTGGVADVLVGSDASSRLRLRDSSNSNYSYTGIGVSSTVTLNAQYRAA